MKAIVCCDYMVENKPTSSDDPTQSKDDTESKAKRKQGQVIVAEISDMKATVADHQDARIIYDNGFYGYLEKDKTLTLSFEETLHLLERGVIKVTDENGVWLEVDDCARVFTQKDDRFWTDYLVYKDLRNRGYVINRGISDMVKYRLYPRGAKASSGEAKTLICPLAEGQSLNLATMDKLLKQTQSLKKRLLIACVDRLGDVSYYELQRLFDQ